MRLRQGRMTNVLEFAENILWQDISNMLLQIIQVPSFNSVEKAP